MGTLTIELLGPLRVTGAGGDIANLKYDKVRALLAYIAVESGRAHSREKLAALLWPDLPAPAARNNIRQALHTLRQAIGDDADYLVTTRTTVQFNSAAPHHLDHARFTEAITFARRHAHRNPDSCQTCAARLEKAISLFRGPFLDGLSLPDGIAFEEWALLQRERLNLLALDALQRLLQFHSHRGDYDRAASFAQRQLAIEPWREQAHRALMRLYFLRDRRAAALSQYETCRAILHEELNVEPEERTTALYREILAATGSDGTSAGLIPETSAPPFHIPLPPTPFIGRQTELDELARLLDAAVTRLITITGPGGVGKTRLALQAASDQINLFKDGIYFVSLLSLQDAANLPGLMAHTLNLDLQPASGAAALDALDLAHALKGKECLILLDNFDHLVDDSLILEPLLRLAPELNLLVTSRQRLNLQAEWVFPLSGFSLLQPGTAQAASVSDNAALQLFAASARRAGVDFQLTQQNVAHVTRICALLEGLPLAIELAAGWTRVLSLPEIADEIERSARFLTAHQRDIPQRHHSLWAVLDQSWKLLSTAQQQSLAQLSVFQSAFTRDAAAAVAGTDLDMLANLVDLSLLQRHPPHRYALHPLLRQYAAEQGGQGVAMAGSSRRHFEYFLARVQTLAADGEDHDRRLQQLAAEYDDVRAALSWISQNGDAERGLKLAAAVYRFWYWRSYFREGSDWLTVFLERISDDPPPELHARALYARGVLLSQQNRHDAARSDLQQSLAIRRQLGDRPAQAACLNSLGIIAWRREEYEEASALLEESLALRRELGDSDLGPPLNNLGLVAIAQGHFSHAESYFGELLRRERQLGREMGIAISAGNMALAQLEQQRLPEARAHLIEATALFQQLGDREGLAGCLETAAALAVSESDMRAAVHFSAAAETLRQTINAPRSPSERLRVDKTLAAAQGALAPAAFTSAWEEGAAQNLDQHLARLTG